MAFIKSSSKRKISRKSATMLPERSTVTLPDWLKKKYPQLQDAFENLMRFDDELLDVVSRDRVDFDKRIENIFSKIESLSTTDPSGVTEDTVRTISHQISLATKAAIVAMKGIPNGFATLGQNGKIPIAQIPLAQIPASHNTLAGLFDVEGTPLNGSVLVHNGSKFQITRTIDNNNTTVSGGIW